MSDSFWNALSEWVDDVEVVLTANSLMVEHYAVEDETVELYARAMEAPKEYFGALQKFIKLRNDPFPSPVRGAPGVDFRCERALASIVFPMVSFIVDPIPNFMGLQISEDDGGEALRKKVVKAYGLFIGMLATNVRFPLRALYPDLEPTEP